jgi:uncharacterized protein YaaN involved in tellurite resistance
MSDPGTVAQTNTAMTGAAIGGTLPAIPLDNAQVQSIKQSIDISDTAQMTAFGERAQQNVASFADQILSQTKNKELGDTGALLTDVIIKAKSLDPTELGKQNFITRMFGGLHAQLIRFQSRYESVAAQIDRITLELEKRIDILRRDVTMLDSLHDQTKASIGNLDAYIAAGKQFGDEYSKNQLPKLQAAAAGSGDSSKDVMTAQQYQDAVQALDRLQKRVLYLQQARQIAIQQMPQIRIVQNGDTTLIESLQASVTLTVPAWKQKMVLILGLTRQEEALEMQKTVTDTTNRLLREASDMMKTQAVDIETQSQRGIVDIETLQKTNQDLIDTIQGVLTVQAQGRQKRAAIEAEMDRQTAALKAVLAKGGPGT